MVSKINSLQSLLGLLLIIVVLFCVYFQGLHGPFIFDDFGNIVNNESLLIKELNWDTLRAAMFSKDSGPLGRPISMASFAFNYYFLGSSGLGFKAVNLFIHIINTCLVYCLVLLILRCFNSSQKISHLSRFAALFATAMWAFHPINLTSVVFVVQRMTSLSAMFLLIGINIYIYQRLKVNNEERMPVFSQVLGVFSVCFFTLLSTLSKETGLLLPGFVGLIELFLFNAKGLYWRNSPIIWMFSALTVVGCVAVLGMFFDWHRYSFARFDEIYQARPFTLGERLLTEVRVMWFYIAQIWIPDITKMGLHHDDFIVSKDMFSPLSTLYSIVIWLLVAVLLIVALVANKLRMVSFSVMWFLWGHIMESTVIPLELVYEHRNYIPMLGFVFAWAWLMQVSILKFSRLKVSIVVFFICSLLASATFSRASNWKGWGELALSEVARHPNSSRNQHEAGRWYFAQLMQEERISSNKNYIQARKHFEAALKADQSNSAGLYALFRLNGVVGKPIEPGWIDELEFRMKSQVITSEHNINLVDWLRCVVSGSCVVDDKYIERVASAFSNNNSVMPKNKAMVCSYFGVYELARGSLTAAVEYFRIAKESWPQEPQNWENLIRGLIRANDRETAKLLLQEYKSAFSSRTNEFEELTKLLMESQINGA